MCFLGSNSKRERKCSGWEGEGEKDGTRAGALDVIFGASGKTTKIFQDLECKEKKRCLFCSLTQFYHICFKATALEIELDIVVQHFHIKFISFLFRHKWENWPCLKKKDLSSPIDWDCDDRYYFYL